MGNPDESETREVVKDVGRGQTISSGRVLGIVSLATILALSIWFSTNAIGPALEREKGLSTPTSHG